jgi:hypothetical protein
MSDQHCDINDPILLKKWAFGETLQRYKVGDMFVEQVKAGHTFIMERMQKGSTLLRLIRIESNNFHEGDKLVLRTRISPESLSGASGGAAVSAPNGTQNAVNN